MNSPGTGDIREALGEHDFFAAMDPRHLDTLAEMSRWSDHAAGSWLACAGDAPDSFHAIVSGRVGIEVTATGRAPLVVATVHAGDVVGWSWFIGRQPWQFDVVALDNVRSIALDVNGLLDACDRSDDLRDEITTRLLRVVADRLRSARLQLVDLYGHDR
jgi:CRP/FNR family transcriptional regulator, cyclic AMP receptor protein